MDITPERIAEHEALKSHPEAINLADGIERDIKGGFADYDDLVHPASLYSIEMLAFTHGLVSRTPHAVGYAIIDLVTEFLEMPPCPLTEILRAPQVA